MRSAANSSRHITAQVNHFEQRLCVAHYAVFIVCIMAIYGIDPELASAICYAVILGFALPFAAAIPFHDKREPIANHLRGYGYISLLTSYRNQTASLLCWLVRANMISGAPPKFNFALLCLQKVKVRSYGLSPSFIFHLSHCQM
jgi:hypothetical protein